MRRKREPRKSGANPETEEKLVPVTEQSRQEPTIKDWHALLNAILEQNDDIQLTVQLLLFSSPSGHAFLEYLREYRPKIGDAPTFDILELVTAYEALDLLRELVAEPRFGTDPSFFIWREYWDDSSRGPSSAYQDLIEFSLAIEAKAKNEEERVRIRMVREAIERELQGEEYRERRKSLLGKPR